MTVAMITASTMLSTLRATAAAMAIMTMTRTLFMTSISFMVAWGRMCLWTMSRDMHEAPEVAKVSAQDMEAAANPIATTATAAPGRLSWMKDR